MAISQLFSARPSSAIRRSRCSPTRGSSGSIEQTADCPPPPSVRTTTATPSLGGGRRDHRQAQERADRLAETRLPRPLPEIRDFSGHDPGRQGRRSRKPRAQGPSSDGGDSSRSEPFAEQACPPPLTAPVHPRPRGLVLLLRVPRERPKRGRNKRVASVTPARYRGVSFERPPVAAPATWRRREP